MNTPEKINKHFKEDALICSEYFAYPAINASSLKRAVDSLWHYFNPAEKEQSKAMQLGTLLHVVVLEPDNFDKMFKVVGTTPGSELEKSLCTYLSKGVDFDEACKLAGYKRNPDMDKFRSKYADYIYALAFDIQPISNQEKKWAFDRLSDLQAHPYASKMLFGKSGYNELPLRVTHETGLSIKAKYDRLILNKHRTAFSFDLKKCTDASPEGFRRQAEKFGYGISASFYQMILELLLPEGWIIPPMRFICIEENTGIIGIHEIEQYQIEEIRYGFIEPTLREIAAIKQKRQEKPTYPYIGSKERSGVNTIELSNYYINSIKRPS